MLIEIHVIQNHSPSNLNRDDLGAPKTCLFGGVTRARISSQCLKRSIRNPGNPDDVHNPHPGMFAEAMRNYMGWRTKFFPDLVSKELRSSEIPSTEHDRIVQACAAIAKREEEKAGVAGEAEETDDRPRLPQLVFLDRSEAKHFVRKLAEMRASDEWNDSYKKWIDGELQKKALAHFLHALSRAYQRRSVDIALFGRMTTSDAFEDVEAAMQVAHAISTHQVVNEVDYFTAVDDLGKAGGGAAHVDEAMFNSACFYKYFSLDWDQLVDNLAGPEPKDPDAKAKKEEHDDYEKAKEAYSQARADAEKLAAATLGHFLHAAAQTSPSGKQNSFASNCDPCGILVEIKKSKTPTSYANAFAEPVERIGKPDDDAADEKSIEGRSIACLANHVHVLRRAYAVDSNLLWFSRELWRFPFHYWDRSPDGKKKTSKLLTEQRFDVLDELVQAVVREASELEWADVCSWLSGTQSGAKAAGSTEA